MAKPTFLEAVPVGRIFLALNNPRHEPYETEGQAIEYLCEHENVHALARDIAKHGINPLERFALLPIDKKKVGRPDASYTAAEGNRRVCAIKLLNDPDLAPARLRKAFEKLAEQWTPVKSISAAVFPDSESVRIWLQRLHNGAQGGAGRKEWNADQKQRFDGGSKNKLALAILDYAEAEKIITKSERKGRLTTAQRFLGNAILQEVLGIDGANPDEVVRTRPKDEFDILLKRFVKDLVEGQHVHSRMNKDEIIKYARPLNGLAGVTSKRIEPETLTENRSGGKRKAPRRRPQQPQHAKHVQYEEEIFTALKALGNAKLSSLYHSICSVELDTHTPLVAVGTWSFFETLTGLAGRNEGVSLDAWLSKTKLASYGITGDSVSSLRSAMVQIREFGNTTKHHPIAALFSGDQLNNDVCTLKAVILKAIEEAASKGA